MVLQYMYALLRGFVDFFFSYVPNTLHPVIAKQCLDSKVSMVTTSYVSPAMKVSFNKRVEYLTTPLPHTHTHTHTHTHIHIHSLSLQQALHKPAIDAGITILNEVGVDPGIDHMLAMECFDEVLSKGGKVHQMISIHFSFVFSYVWLLCP